MVYAKGFFDLQLSFAERVRDLLGIPLEVALLERTNLYVRFGFGRDFNVEHDGWQSYLSGLRGTRDRREWTYRFYLRDAEARTAPSVVATFGCCSYAVPGGDHVRLHFRNTESGGSAPLGSDRVERRRAELASLFAHLKPSVSPETPVVGASWLYNLEAYRRLFPPSYVSTASPIPDGFRSMALWGQFLDRRGDIRKARVAAFLSALDQTTDPGGLTDRFPLHALIARAPVGEFCDHYRV